MAADTQRAARNTVALIIARVVSNAVLFLWQLVLANWLGPVQYGIYGTVIALMNVVAPLGGMGMGIMMIREVARQPALIGRYWTAMLFLQTVLSLGAYVAAVVFGIVAGYEPDLVAYAALAAISLLIDVVGTMSYDLLLAQERMTITSAIEVLHTFIRIGVAALALRAGWGLTGVYLVTIGTGMFRTALLWGANWRSGVRPLMPLDQTIARPLLWNTLPLMLNAWLNQLYQHIDKLLTTALIGTRATGYLTPAFTIHFGVLEVLNTTVLVALFPLMSRVEGVAFGQLVGRLTRFMALVSLPITLTLSLFAPPLLGLVLPSFGLSAHILRILIWYTLLSMVGNVLAQALLVQNRQRLLLGLRAIGLSINIGLNLLLLVALHDPRGAALASVTAEAVMFGLLLWNFRAVGYDVRELLIGLGRIVLLGAVAGLVMLLAGTVHFLIGIVAGLGVYAAGTLWVLRGEDWDLLHQVAVALPLVGRFIGRVWRRETIV